MQQQLTRVKYQFQKSLQNTKNVLTEILIVGHYNLYKKELWTVVTEITFHTAVKFHQKGSIDYNNLDYLKTTNKLHQI